MLQEFDFTVKDRNSSENVVADHLSRIENESRQQIIHIVEEFPNERIFKIKGSLPWFANYVNYLAGGVMPPDLSSQQKKKVS